MVTTTREEMKNGYNDAEDGQTSQAWTAELARTVKRGDVVAFKHDIEQQSKVESVSRDFGGRITIMVRAHEGGYVNDRISGTPVHLMPSDIFGFWRKS